MYVVLMILQRDISQVAHTCWRQHQNSVAFDQPQNRSRHLRPLNLKHNVLVSKSGLDAALPSSNASSSLFTVESRDSCVVILVLLLTHTTPYVVAAKGSSSASIYVLRRALSFCMMRTQHVFVRVAAYILVMETQMHVLSLSPRTLPKKAVLEFVSKPEPAGSG